MGKRRKTRPRSPGNKAPKPVIQARNGQSNAVARQALAMIPRIVSLLTEGQVEQALPLIQKGMQLAPDHPEFAHLAGHIIRGSAETDREEARQWLKRAVDLAPSNPRYAVSLSSALLRDGYPEQALEWARYAVKADARFTDAYVAIGLALIRLGRRHEAVDVFSNATRVQPDNADLWKNLALCRMELGEVEEVLDTLSCLEQRIAAPSAALLVELSEICRRLGLYSNTRDYLRKALKKDPSSPEAWFRLACVLGSLESYDDAGSALEKARCLGYALGDIRFIEGEFLRKKQHFNDAILKYEEALLLAEGDASLILKISWAFSKLRRFDDQLRCLNLVLDMDTKDPWLQSELDFGLGLVFEAKNEHHQAFECFSNANSLRRELSDYRFRSDETRFHRLLKFYARESVGAPSERCVAQSEPIIICGTSRSGKTLTESLLSLHDSVVPRGEAGVFPQLIRDLRAKRGMPAYPEMVKKLSPETLQWLGREYEVRTTANEESERFFTDTHPDNTEYLPLIEKCLPGAKILICRRDARDVCVSMYTSAYTGGHHYSEDLSDLGNYWLLHEKTLSLWQELIPNSIYHVSFEQLIQCPEDEAKKLMAFCGIDVSDGYFKRVRELISDPWRWPSPEDAIGVWKPYGPYLSPLLSVLDGARR